jgi:hypothetical protein
MVKHINIGKFKYEYRIPKFETNTNYQNSNVQNGNRAVSSNIDLLFWSLDHSNFDIVSNFELRISNFSNNLNYIVGSASAPTKFRDVC